jgi:hypothetical protein
LSFFRIEMLNRDDVQAEREKFMWLAVPRERPAADGSAEMGIRRRTVDPVKRNFIRRPVVS